MLQEIITETKHSRMDLKQWVKKAAKVVAEILAFQGNWVVTIPDIVGLWSIYVDEKSEVLLQLHFWVLL